MAAQADEERFIRQQEFFNLIIEVAKTEDGTRLSEWWRRHYPGWKMWMTGPIFSLVLPDDGID